MPSRRERRGHHPADRTYRALIGDPSVRVDLQAGGFMPQGNFTVKLLRGQLESKRHPCLPCDVVVVADTSVLLNLCRVQLDWLLPRLFGDVWIPPAVDQEFRRLAVAHGRFQGLALPSWVRLSDPVALNAN